MKCHVCNEGRMLLKTSPETVAIDGVPTFEIEGIQHHECDSCHDELIDSDSTRERTKKILTHLIRSYSSRFHVLPGGAAHWMRHAIGLSENDLAGEVGVIHAPLLATTGSACTDRYTAFVLLALCADFVTGQTKHVDELLRVNS
jgi:YgiT-type zinc finger domain-containing protein